MSDEERALYDHILSEYQQDVHQLKFSLARANAQSAQKDRRIAELEASQAPKPGPR